MNRPLPAILLLGLLPLAAQAGIVMKSEPARPTVARELGRHADGIVQATEDAAIRQGMTLDRERLALRPEPAPARTRKARRFTCMPDGEEMEINAIAGIELSYTDAEIRDVLAELSGTTGVTIVMDESVEGQVSVNLKDASLAEALEVILAAGGYSYKVAARHILVGAPDPRSRSFAKLSSTCIFKPENAQPEQLTQALPAMYQAFVTVQSGNRHVSITAPMDIQRRLQAALTALDQPQPQVLLEMSIIEVSSKAMEVLGVSWSKMIRDNQVPGGVRQLGTGEWSSLGANPATTISGSLIQTGVSPARSLAESVQFLKTRGDASVKAMPSIVTQDGRQAVFSSQSTVWLPFDSVNSSSDKRKELTYGINMTVIPRISTEGDIKLEIKDASVSNLVMDDRGSPQIVSHQIASTVDIQDGDTLVLGGLFQHKQRDGRAGLPGLSRLRVVGNLFGQSERRNEETEVLILIRPTILEAGG